jgi:HEAT repeat protein
MSIHLGNPRGVTCAAAITGAALLAGCSTSVEPSYEDPTPQARLGAIAESAKSGSTADLPHLIENLSSDDESVRFAAIGALRRTTGLTNGYRFDASYSERTEAIARWKAWFESRTASQ